MRIMSINLMGLLTNLEGRVGGPVLQLLLKALRDLIMSAVLFMVV